MKVLSSLRSGWRHTSYNWSSVPRTIVFMLKQIDGEGYPSLSLVLVLVCCFNSLVCGQHAPDSWLSWFSRAFMWELHKISKEYLLSAILDFTLDEITRKSIELKSTLRTSVGFMPWTLPSCELSQYPFSAGHSLFFSKNIVAGLYWFALDRKISSKAFHCKRVAPLLWKAMMRYLIKSNFQLSLAVKRMWFFFF